MLSYLSWPLFVNKEGRQIQDNTQKPAKKTYTEIYEINTCWDCPNKVIDLEQAAQACSQVFQDIAFTEQQKHRLGIEQPNYHHIFRVAISGCPNSCNQPQIKDFGLQGKAVPLVGEGCSQCGLCVKACPDRGILLGENGPEIDRSLCLNCGKCARCCPTGAITIGESGYRVIRGGKLGRRPMLAQEVLSLTDQQGYTDSLRQTLDLLLKEGRFGERLGVLLERMGK